MTTKDTQSNDLLYSCSTCLKWVSGSAAIIFEESKNYFKYFCGTECHDKWHAKQEGNNQKTKDIA